MSVFSELQAVYSAQRNLHELHFHHHDDKKLLETRVRGAMTDLGERLTRVALAPSNSAIQKRQNIATELQNISSLVEGMLTMAKRSYSAALMASHMSHLAYEYNVTISSCENVSSTLRTKSVHGSHDHRKMQPQP